MLDPDAPVTPTRIACLDGGPGLLDQLLAVDDLRHVDFVEPQSHCSLRVYSNRSANDADWLKSTWKLSGLEVCRSCQAVLDADYKFYPGREVLNQPWYRQSVDGDSPLFDGRGAADVRSGIEMQLALPKNSPGSALAFRIASHAYGSLVLQCGDEASTIRLLPENGFRWFVIQAKKPLSGCGRTTITFEVDQTKPANVVGIPGRIAFDGVVFPNANGKGVASPTGSISAFATDRFSPGRDRRFFAINALMQPAVHEVTSGFYRENGVFAMSPATRTAKLSFLWSGPDTRAFIYARVQDGQNAAFSLEAGATSRSCCFEKHMKQASSILGFWTSLRKGERIAISVRRGGFHSHPALEAFTAVANRPLAPFGVSPSMFSGASISPARHPPPRRTRAVQPLHRTRFSAAGITGRNGNALEFSIPAVSGATTVFAGFVGTDGDGTAAAHLLCGTRRKTVFITADSARGVSLDTAGAACRLRISWTDKPLTIGRVFFNVTRTSVSGTLPVWLPKGSYTVRNYAKDLHKLRQGSISIDGLTATAGASIDIRKTGRHTLALHDADARSAFVAFFPRRFATHLLALHHSIAPRRLDIP